MTQARARSFRLVCPPERIPEVEALLTAEGYAFTPEAFSPWCRRCVAEPQALGASLAAFFGLIYIQDRSSMLPPLALDPQPGAAVLDMCASPGSKTGFLAQLVGRGGFVLGNEPAKPRLATLRANLQTLNLLQAATCTAPGEKLPLVPGSWEYIQLDPPCSGWGTVEKNPQVLKLWQGGKVKPLVGLQRLLLHKAHALLKPGGRVLYSTCTTNVEENEAQTRYAVEELGFTVCPLPHFPGFVWEEPLPGGAGTLRVDGARSGAQGFYLALLQKPAGTPVLALPEEAEGAEEAAGLAYEPPAALSPALLEGPCVDTGQLPEGLLTVYGEMARFIPQKALPLLTRALHWQAAPLGKMAGDRVRLGARSRLLLPAAPPPEALVLEKVEDIHRLLQGQSLHTALTGRETGLYWQDLPLGRVGLKQGRVVWNAK